jgi:alkanesulfonate monooxygenase SsuD/methylene tetrahydromethanopterin reductase-like flavin-dependent oxidoreductase (luciferase family)
MFRRFGIALGTGHAPDHLVALARRADELGFDSFWLAEIYHQRSAIPVATLIGSATSRIKIGLGVLLTRTRHPALVAMETATLAELNGDRLLLGLGVGRGSAVYHGSTRKLVPSLRDSLTIVRRMLDGGEVTFAGEAFSVERARLGFPVRRKVPLYVGCYPFSPKALELTGALADGVVYVWTTPELVRRASETIAEAAHKAHRDPSAIDVAAYFILAVDDDPGRARDACRLTIASYTRIAHIVWRQAGLVTADDVDPVLGALERGGVEAGAAAVSDTLIEKVAIAGNARYCRDRLREYVGTGLDLPIAYAVLGPDPMAALQMIAADLAVPGAQTR